MCESVSTHHSYQKEASFFLQGIRSMFDGDLMIDDDQKLARLKIMYGVVNGKKIGLHTAIEYIRSTDSRIRKKLLQ